MQSRASRSLRPVAAGLATLSLAVGCSAPEGVSEAGFPEPPVHLTLGLADSPAHYSWSLAEDFARRVDIATAGAVEVELTNEGTEVRGWNQALAQRTQQAEFDLALVQAQAWDDLGVTSLTALYVPFVIVDEEHLDAVATSDLAAELLAGLDGTGVTGLALVPGGMRHLFRPGDPAVRPADLQGDRVRSARSRTIWDMLEAYGAEPDDPNGPEVDAQILAGTITAVDSLFALADASFEAPATAGDLALYPLAFTLVANDDSLGELSRQHQQALRAAAADTTRWAARTRSAEAAEAQTFCDRNSRARVVIAGDDALQEWRDTAAPLGRELRSDPVVDDLATRIEALAGASRRSEPVRACGPATRDTDAATVTPAATGGPDQPGQPNVPESFPEGLYRKDIAPEALVAAGASPSDAHTHAGIWTIILQDGVWGPTEGSDCPGSTYTVAADRLVVTLGPTGDGCGTAAGKVLFSAHWHLAGDSLSFTDVRSGHGSDPLIAGIFGSDPWTRIG